MRALRNRHPDLDEERVAADLTAFLKTPRTNVELRARIATHDGAPPDPNMPLLYARTLLPLTFLPPAGHWHDTTRKARFVLDPRPLPDPEAAAALVLTRYLEAFGPASRKDVAGWAGVAQRDFPWERVQTVTFRDEKGRELLDLPGRPLPPAETRAPAALPRPLGPAAAGLRRPRPHHPARGPAAEADPERRLHRDRRRPRRRELAHGRAEARDQAAHRLRPRRRHGRGAADGALLRAREALKPEVAFE